MVRTHLAAVDCIFLAHPFLDEGVAGLALHRTATEGLHQVHRVPGQAWIVHDGGPRILQQERHRQQAHQVVALDKLAALIEEKAAIEVAIPGDAHVGAVGDNCGAGQRAVFRQ